MARFTFAIVGHDEVQTLPYAIAMAKEAAGPGDSVWFVDSESSDGSAQVARSLGAEVIDAPIGKGRAMQVAMDLCRDEFVCFLDADYAESTINIPRQLRDATTKGDYDLVVGAYEEPSRRRTLTPGLYLPLMRSLFPEIDTSEHLVPLSGFRVLRTGFPFGRFPPGYGVESYLNIETVRRGGRVMVCPVGYFRGDLRNYRNVVEIGRDMTATILDLAVAHDRINEADRPLWEGWIHGVLDTIASQPPAGGADNEFLSRLREVAARPLPVVRCYESD